MKVNVDKLGAYASGICAVHCVLTGLALGLLSVSGLSFIASGTSELVFVTLAVGLGTIAVFHGKRKHHSFVPAIFFSLGMLFLVVSHFVFGHSESGNGHWMFSVLGGCCLVTFHFLNQRYARLCGCDHCATGE